MIFSINKVKKNSIYFKIEIFLTIIDTTVHKFGVGKFYSFF